MLLRVAICCWLFALPGIALAQTVVIDSGEHSTFTRLTLPLSGGEWSLTRSGTGYDLALEGVDGFDLSRAFEKISRDRIAAIEATDPNHLRIELSCDCMATAFVWRGNFLVIDVSQNTAPAPPALPPVARAPDALPVWFPTDIALPLPFAPSASPDPTSAVATGASEAPPSGSGIHVQAQAEPEEQSTISLVPPDFETVIAQDLARAATQGLLTLAEPVNPERGAEPEPGAEPDVVPPATEDAATSSRPGIKIETSIDRAVPPDIEIIDPLEERHICLDQGIFEFPELDEGQTVSTSLSEIRSALYPDPQQIDLAAALELVRALISFGFGAEARQAINLAELPDDEATVLRAMAHIVDGEVPEARLADEAGCSKEAFLWAYIADLVETPEPLVPLIEAFRALPNSLREPLGYRLAARLAVDGAQNEADAVYQLARAAGLGEAPSASITAAQLDQRAGQPAAARRELEGAIAAGTRPTPELLLDLFAASDSEGKAVTDAQIVLIEEAIFALRGAEQALPLEAALIRARIGRAELMAAQKDLSEKKASFDEAIYQDLADHLATAALTASDDLFLRIAFDDNVLPTDAKLRISLSERLGALGFAARANEISQPLSQEALEPEPTPPAPDPVASLSSTTGDEDPVSQARQALEAVQSALTEARDLLAGGN